MKKILFLLALLPIFFISCSDDDDNNYDIVGSWKTISATPKEVNTNNANATQAIKDDITTNYDDGNVYTYTSDGKLKINNQDVGTYSLSGNTLTITILGASGSSNIVSLDNGMLTVDSDETKYYKEEVEYLAPKEKNVTVSKVVTTYTYKKQ